VAPVLLIEIIALLQEDYVKYCTRYALEHCADDLHYFEHEYPAGEKGLRERLLNVVNSDFAQITYTEAVELLQTHIAEKKVEFLVYPSWGDDLGSEHERYITEKVGHSFACILLICGASWCIMPHSSTQGRTAEFVSRA
jgi:asparaginyl-tRNA synthetase